MITVTNRFVKTATNVLPYTITI